MNDALLMRVLNRLADGDEQFDPRLEGKFLPLAVVRDADALDQFHDEVRPARHRRARVENFGDVRMVHHRQRLPLGLKTRDLATLILSNTNDIAISHVLSYECAALKPLARIYEITEQRTGCRGAEILFLDDKLENVEAAAQRGWQTICHASVEESGAKVRNLLPS